MTTETERRANNILEVFEGWHRRNENQQVPEVSYLQGVYMALRAQGYGPEFTKAVLKHLRETMADRGYFTAQEHTA